MTGQVRNSNDTPTIEPVDTQGDIPTIGPDMTKYLLELVAGYDANKGENQLFAEDSLQTDVTKLGDKFMHPGFDKKKYTQVL